MKVQTCLVCGKTFQSPNKRRYCSDKCRNAHYRMMHPDYARNYYEKNVKADIKPKKKSKKKRSKTLAEISAEAKAAGMTYGKYIAFIEMGVNA